MRKSQKLIIAILGLLLAAAPGAWAAENDPWNVEFEDSYKETGYEGFEEYEGAIHAIKGGKLIITPNVAQFPSDLKQIDYKIGDEIVLTVYENFDNKVEIDITNLGENVVKAELIYPGPGFWGLNFDPYPITTVKIYDVPQAPELQEHRTLIPIRDIEKCNESFSCTAGENGNPGGWRYKWLLESDTELIGAGIESTSLQLIMKFDVEGNAPKIREERLLLSVNNLSPSGKKKWAAHVYEVATIMSYNTPPQPELNTFTDGIDKYYVCSNTGIKGWDNETKIFLSNAQTSKPDTIVKARSLQVSVNEDPAYNQVSTLWVYDDDFRVYSEPSKISHMVNINFSNFDIKIEDPKIEGYLGYVHSDDLYYTLDGCKLTYAGNISDDNSDDQFKFSRRYSIYFDEFNYTEKNQFDNNSNRAEYSITPGADDKFQPWAVLTISLNVEPAFSNYFEMKFKSVAKETVHVLPRPEMPKLDGAITPDTIADYQVQAKLKALPQITPASGANTNAWQYQWLNSDEILGETGITLSDDYYKTIQKEFGGDEKKKKPYNLRLRYTNTAPNGQVWIEGTLDVANFLCCNSPKSPGGTFIYSKDNNYTNADFYATNIGYSDEDLATYKYKFAFKVNGEDKFHDKRSISFNECGSIIPSEVRSCWEYIDDSGNPFPIYSATYASFEGKSPQTPRFSPETKVAGVEDDEYYCGAQNPQGSNTIYALAGSDIEYVQSVDTGSYELDNVKFEVFNEKEEIIPGSYETNGNKSSYVINNVEPGTYTAKISFKCKIAVEENGKQYADLDFESAGSFKTVKIFEKPEYPEVPKLDEYKIAEDEKHSVNLDRKRLSAGNPDGWEYQWVRVRECEDDKNLFEEIQLTGDLRDNGDDLCPDTLTPEVIKIDYRGKRIVTYTYYSRMINKIDGDTLIYYNKPVRKVYVHNNPEVNSDCVVGCVEDGNGTRNYVVKNTGFTDDELEEYGYEFLFDKQIHGSRLFTTTGDISSVIPVFKYETGLQCKGDTINFDVDTKEVVVMNMRNKVSNGKLDSLHYTGEVIGSDGLTCAINGSKVTYHLSFTINGENRQRREFKDFPQIKGFENEVNNSDQSMNADTIFYYEYYPKDLDMVYGGLVKASYKYNTEPSGNKYIDIPLQFKTKNSDCVKLYPVPVAPKLNPEYKNQFRDFDQLDIDMSFDAPTGAVEQGWRYEWTFNGNKIATSNHAECYVTQPRIESESMVREEREIKVYYYNLAPDGVTKWLSGELSYPIYVYNTPRMPGSLVRKGDGTSNVYIAKGISNGSSVISDEMLATYNYLFEFGTKEGGNFYPVNNRWYDFSGHTGTPCVRTLWKYDDFDCYSDYVYAEGGRAESTSISSIKADGGVITGIYTIGGMQVHAESEADLRPGMYIVNYVAGGDCNSVKIIVK